MVTLRVGCAGSTDGQSAFLAPQGQAHPCAFPACVVTPVTCEQTEPVTPAPGGSDHPWGLAQVTFVDGIPIGQFQVPVAHHDYRERQQQDRHGGAQQIQCRQVLLNQHVSGQGHHGNV
jgi:hypothetical protein